MSTCTPCAALALNPPSSPRPLRRLSRALHALWRRQQDWLIRQHQREQLSELSQRELQDINAPDWLRRDVLHHAEMEHYDRMRTLGQFRGFM